MPTSIITRSALFIAGAALALLCSLTSCEQDAPSTPPPAEVSVISVRPRTVDVLATVPGRTVAYRVAEIRPQVSGVLLKRMFEEGTDVKEEEQLYQIDPRPFKAQLDQAEATKAKDEANLENARRDLARYAALLPQQLAVTRKTYDTQWALVAQLAATVAADAAAVDTARIDLNYTKMLSPISGRIGRSAVTEGALMTANQATAVATVTQLDPIYVDITQSSADLLPLRRQLQNKNLSANSGASIPVDLTLEDGRPYGLPGKLSFSEVSVDEGTGTMTLRATIPNPNHLLLPGMYIRATLHEGTHENAYLVPQSAVQRNVHADPYLYVVNQKDEVEQRLIQIDGSQGNDWVVVEGLNPGERIITEGLQRVNPGEHVHPTEAAPQADDEPTG